MATSKDLLKLKGEGNIILYNYQSSPATKSRHSTVYELDDGLGDVNYHIIAHGPRLASFCFGVRIWLGRFSINYLRGLGLRIRVWVRV